MEQQRLIKQEILHRPLLMPYPRINMDNMHQLHFLFPSLSLVSHLFLHIRLSLPAPNICTRIFYHSAYASFSSVYFSFSKLYLVLILITIIGSLNLAPHLREPPGDPCKYTILIRQTAFHLHISILITNTSWSSSSVQSTLKLAREAEDWISLSVQHVWPGSSNNPYCRFN